MASQAPQIPDRSAICVFNYEFHPNCPTTVRVGENKRNGKDIFLSVSERKKHLFTQYFDHRLRKRKEASLRISWDQAFQLDRFHGSCVREKEASRRRFVGELIKANLEFHGGLRQTLDAMAEGPEPHSSGADTTQGYSLVSATANTSPCSSPLSSARSVTPFDMEVHVPAATPDSIRPLRAPKAQQDTTTSYVDGRSSAPAAAYTAPIEALPVSTLEPSQSKTRLLKRRRAELDADDNKSHAEPFIPGSSAPQSVRVNNEEGRKIPIFAEDAQGSTPRQFQSGTARAEKAGKRPCLTADQDLKGEMAASREVDQYVDHIMKDAFPQDHGAPAIEKDTSTTKISTPEDGATSRVRQDDLETDGYSLGSHLLLHQLIKSVDPTDDGTLAARGDLSALVETTHKHPASSSLDHGTIISTSAGLDVSLIGTFNANKSHGNAIKDPKEALKNTLLLFLTDDASDRASVCTSFDGVLGLDELFDIACAECKVASANRISVTYMWSGEELLLRKGHDGDIHLFYEHIIQAWNFLKADFSRDGCIIELLVHAAQAAKDH